MNDKGKVVLQFPILRENRVYNWAREYRDIIVSQNRQISELLLTSEVPQQFHKQVRALADRSLKRRKDKEPELNED